MITIDELRAKLSAHLKRRRESQNAFARRLNIQQGSVSRFLTGSTGLALEPALKVLQDMGYAVMLTSSPGAISGESAASGPDDHAQYEITRLQNEVARLNKELQSAERALHYADMLLDTLKKQHGDSEDPTVDASP